MIQPPKYRNRSHDFLHDKLREAMNKLQMRDWLVLLYTEDYPPEQFTDDDTSDCSGMALINAQYLSADIWISPKRAKADDVDPLFYLYHELAHLWFRAHDEEVRCNIIASML